MRTVTVSAREMEVLISSETARPSEPPTVPDRGIVAEAAEESSPTCDNPLPNPMELNKSEIRTLHVCLAIVAFILAVGILIASGVAWR